MPVFLVLMPWTIRMCLRQLPLRLKTKEQTWHLVAPICIGMWWYRELRCWKHFPQMSHLWTNGFPSSLTVVRKLYGCSSREDVWPLDTPKKPGHNCIFQTIFNIHGTLPKTSVQTHRNKQCRLPSTSSQHTANPFCTSGIYCCYTQTAYHTNYSHQLHDHSLTSISCAVNINSQS